MSVIGNKIGILDIPEVELKSIRAELDKNGIKVNCWTVDDPERAEQLAEWGVDYITTNILE